MSLRVGMAQINVTVGDLAGNQAKMVDYAAQAERQGVDLVVFPEMAVCGYPPEDLLHKDHFVKDNLKTLRALAAIIKDVVAVVGFVDQDEDKNLYNAAAVLAHGKIQGITHKEALPNYGVFDELRYFKQGQKHPLFECEGVWFGVNICEDIWVDQGVYTRQVAQGAQVLVNLSFSPYDVEKSQQRQRLLVSRAKALGVFIVYVNGVGGQDELVFDGGSVIISPQGEVVARGKAFDEDLVIADIEEINVTNSTTSTFDGIFVSALPLRSSRPDIKKSLAPVHSSIEGVYAALKLGTRDYIRKNGFNKVLIGLSGGVDSAVVAALAVEALGQDQVVAVTMPSRYTSKGTHTDAAKLAANLGIELIEVPIESLFNAYLEVMAPFFKDTKPNIAEENIQARIRGNILMALSNKFGWIVLTTGNKSEMAVGYCTLYGDMSGGFAMIKDVPKLMVYDLARYINDRVQHDVIPLRTITRAPSAELRANQKDQDFLPPYEILDDLLSAYVEQHQSLAHMIHQQDPETVKKIITLVDRNEYKRRQAAVGIKITGRAFGKDWRLPITNKYKEF